MKNRSSSRKSKRGRKKKHSPPGSSPGLIHLELDALKPVINTFVYNGEVCVEKELKTIDEITAQLTDSADKFHWIDVKGFGDQKFLEQIADGFGIHRLQIEDVVNGYQRPKVEEQPGYLYIVSRVLEEKERSLVNGQLNLFLGKNFVLTFQENYEDVFDPVRVRIRHGKGLIRTSGAGYLAYAIMDTVIDNYFPILERIGEQLDALEDELIESPSRDSLDQVLSIKRELIAIRRAIWSERDKLNEILRSTLDFFSDQSRLYIRDTYDHTIQILDIVDSYKEVTASLMDVYHSSVSNKLNQVMKVLTIISTIFIPLTFIVGVYGMNFARQNPVDGSSLPLNMPELYSPYGYIYVLITMLVIVILQVIFFFRKGWLSRS
jgi:magnesium transporter